MKQFNINSEYPAHTTVWSGTLQFAYLLLSHLSRVTE